MAKPKHRTRLRRAIARLKSAHHHLHELEAEGLVAVSFHTLTDTLTLALSGEVASHVVDILREALRERRQQLKTEAGQQRAAAREQQAQRAQDRAFVQAAKRASFQGAPPLPYPLPEPEAPAA